MTLEFRDVAYRHPGSRDAGFKDASLRVGDGELVALMGPSGSGKSTLLQLAAGFLRPQSGTLWLDDLDITHLPAKSRELGVVFQSYALFPHMSVADNVAFPLRVRNVDPLERSRRVSELLARVGLSDRADALPGELSGGQQQRAALARAVVFNPRALLLDEPLSSVDGRLRQSLREAIRKVQRATGAPCLLVTHDPEDALSIADRVAVLVEGRLRQVGTPADVYERPCDATVARFTGPINALEAVALDPRRVRTAAGDLMCDHGASTGTRLTLLIRPEQVRLEPSDGPLPPNRLMVERVTVSRVGGVFETQGWIGGASIQARSFEPPPAEACWIVPERAVWAVTAETET